MRGAPESLWITCRHCGNQTECLEVPNPGMIFCTACGLLLAEPGMLRADHLDPLAGWAPLDRIPCIGSWWAAECESGHKRWLTLPLLSLAPRTWACSCGANLKWGSGRPLPPHQAPR